MKYLHFEARVHATSKEMSERDPRRSRLAYARSPNQPRTWLSLEGYLTLWTHLPRLQYPPR